MSVRVRERLLGVRCALMLVTVLMAMSLNVAAQTTPATSASTADVPMDMDSMLDMNMQPSAASAATPIVAPVAKPVEKPPASASPMSGMQHQGMEHQAMSGMDHDAMPGMHHDDMSGMNHGKGSADHSMTMGAMQGGKAPLGARSPDYSDDIGDGSMHGMTMRDAMPMGMLLIDQLEAFHARHGNGQQWEMQGGYGDDSNKLWLRSEGERERGRMENGDIEALWSHAIAPYWNTQLGLRHDLGNGPKRNWAVFGVQGLAPYWFDLEATAYVGPSGRTAARLRAEYELLFTQRLILQPEFELNLYGKADPQRRLGSGLSDANLGLRLRYEINRQFAPYIGVVWVRRFGGTADMARDDHQPVFDQQWVAGVRVWF